MKINDYPSITKYKFVSRENNKTILQNITVNYAMQETHIQGLSFQM